MPTSEQNIDSAYGLNKDARLKALASKAATRSQPRLDPPYPFFVLAFRPDFHGVPASLTAQDIRDAAN